MQQKNFVLFMVACLVLLVGWMWLPNQLWPPRPRPKDDDAKGAAEKKKKDKDKAGPVIALPRLEDLWQDQSKYVLAAAAATAVAAPSGLALFYNSKFPLILAANIKIPQPKVETQTYTLGETNDQTPVDKRFFITAVFTNRAAGVPNLTLNSLKRVHRRRLTTHPPPPL